MDVLLGTMAAAFFLLSMFCAAVMDVKRGEVPNRIWILAICAFPIAVYRVVVAELLLVYTLQAGLMFVLMLLCFRLGLLGGADGKAILLISLTYPWPEVEWLLLSIGSAVTCLGALVIGGFEALDLALLNVYEWHRCDLAQRQMSHPEKKRFWLTRRLLRTGEAGNPPTWKKAAIPLVLYVLVAYLLLLVCNGAV